MIVARGVALPGKRSELRSLKSMYSCPEVIMNVVSQTRLRHSAETELVGRALQGDAQAANRLLTSLSSTNPHLVQIMLETIRDLLEPRLWEYLLRSLATQRWDGQLDCKRRSDPHASKRIDRTLIKAFTQDESDVERGIKEAVLGDALEDPNTLVRTVAGYLLLLRGDLEAIAVLEETLEGSPLRWQLRVIRAMGSYKDARCAAPLLKLLVEGEPELHRQAGRALMNLGEAAKRSWLTVLDHPDSHIRWHAARGLGQIGALQSAPILAEGLRDEEFVVRWASADVLAQLGEAAVPATLAMLTHHELEGQFRQAVIHALHGVRSQRIQERLKPLLDALRGPNAGVEAPMLAQRLLAEWE
jgi:HEAT repeat protein